MVKIRKSRNSHESRTAHNSGNSCGGGSKRRRAHRTKKRTQSYGKYIRKLLREIVPDSTISKKAVSVMNSMMYHVFHLIAVEAGNLVHYKKHQTLCSDDVKTAVKLVLPRCLANYAIKRADRAAQRFIGTK